LPGSGESVEVVFLATRQKWEPRFHLGQVSQLSVPVPGHWAEEVAEGFTWIRGVNLMSLFLATRQMRDLRGLLGSGESGECACVWPLGMLGSRGFNLYQVIQLSVPVPEH
jgi:hypothetical protein